MRPSPYNISPRAHLNGFSGRGALVLRTHLPTDSTLLARFGFCCMDTPVDGKDGGIALDRASPPGRVLGRVESDSGNGSDIR